uniref:NADH dehydrogenase subunit 4L n=1 Tax=Megalophaedusa sublunellata TaxID=1885773 RepID=A0A347Z6D0_9EUPU|nr:NADH dehydrogenase subunit 4L [Megalophaedusa sublunellata]
MSIVSFLFFLMLVVIGIFFSTKRQFLTALLIFETMVLISFVLSLMLIMSGICKLYIFILLLTLGVCEAAMGLGLLLSYIKMNGSDLINFSPLPS